MFEMNVECPKCSKIWIVYPGTPDIVCTCHLYCSDGDQPSDCSLTTINYSGDLKWPVGLHTGDEDEGDDVMHRTYYCSTHNKYLYKQPVLIECDWDRWQSRRAPPYLRMSKGRY